MIAAKGLMPNRRIGWTPFNFPVPIENLVSEHGRVDTGMAC
ncbi:MAG: hypothetical protein WD425_20230 [Nitrospirales bacterium]